MEEVDTVMYLGIVLTKNEGADDDVIARIKKANVAFVQLNVVL